MKKQINTKVVYVDGSYSQHGDLGVWGIGIAIVSKELTRANGKIVKNQELKTHYISGVFNSPLQNSLDAEAIAIKEAILFARSRGIRSCKICTDNRSMVDFLYKTYKGKAVSEEDEDLEASIKRRGSEFRSLILTIQKFLPFYPVEVKHRKHFKTKVAHTLANQARKERIALLKESGLLVINDNASAVTTTQND